MLTSQTLPSPIERYLEHQRTYNRMRWPDWKYAGLADLLLQAGVLFNRGQLPSPARRWSKKRKECFANAYDNVAMDPNRYIYCEGLCWDERLLVPFDHGWFVDRNQPDVALDSTLPRNVRYGYLGLHLRYSAVSKVFYQGLFIGSVLLSPEVGYRIFNGELPLSELLEQRD